MEYVFLCLDKIWWQQKKGKNRVLEVLLLSFHSLSSFTSFYLLREWIFKSSSGSYSSVELVLLIPLGGFENLPLSFKIYCKAFSCLAVGRQRLERFRVSILKYEDISEAYLNYPGFFYAVVVQSHNILMFVVRYFFCGVDTGSCHQILKGKWSKKPYSNNNFPDCEGWVILNICVFTVFGRPGYNSHLAKRELRHKQTEELAA